MYVFYNVRLEESIIRYMILHLIMGSNRAPVATVTSCFVGIIFLT